MTPVVCLGAGALDYPEGKGGGHTWVYLNWALGLRSLGCRVIWLESKPPRVSVDVARERLAILRKFLDHHGFEEIALASSNGQPVARQLADECLSCVDAGAEADLLLDLGHNRSPTEVERFSRTAFVDIDPGLLQPGWSLARRAGRATTATSRSVRRSVPHEPASRTLGLPGSNAAARLPRRVESRAVTPRGAYTTVTHLYAGTVEIDGQEFDNDKRTAFLKYLDLPSRTSTARAGSLPGDG